MAISICGCGCLPIEIKYRQALLILPIDGSKEGGHVLSGGGAYEAARGPDVDRSSVGKAMSVSPSEGHHVSLERGGGGRERRGGKREEGLYYH